MAKSARSKIKRHFRAKKRTEGIYAAVEAARLNRLALKLKAISTADDEGERMQQDPAQAQGGGEGEGEWEDMPGWSWFAAFALLDPGDITADALARLAAPVRARGDRAHVGLQADMDRNDGGTGAVLDHLFPSTSAAAN